MSAKNTLLKSNDLFELETENVVPDSNTPPTGGDETHCGRSKAIAQAMEGTIAQLGNEVFIRSAGKWHKQTGFIERAMLRWWGSNPRKTGLAGAAYQEWAVDPNKESASVYYQRADAKDDWRPILADVNDVYFQNGRVSIVTRELTPYNAGTITFGPIMHCDFNPTIAAACRASDWTAAPEQFVALMGMVDVALADQGTLDKSTTAYFQSVVAQILRPHAGFNQFVHIFGESGARKTTLLRALLSAPCGNGGLNEISEAALAENKFVRSGLINRIANLSNDSAITSRFVPFIKEVTSGVLTTEKKFCDPQPVRLTAKLFATMNCAQKYDDNSLGIENRLIVFKFNERNDNNRSASGMRWMHTEHYSDETKTWITHWLLTGLENCIVNGEELPPAPSARALTWKDELLDQAIPIREFTRKYLTFDRDAFVTSDALTDLAIETGYCGGDETSRNKFKTEIGKSLKAKKDVSATRRTVDGKKCHGLAGVRIKADTVQLNQPVAQAA